MTHTGVESLLNRFSEGAATWGSLMGGNATKANRLFNELHAIAKALGQSADGREGLVKLTSDESVGVRLLAASESLPWAPEVAAAALDVIAASGGLYAVSAKYTLKSFRDGSLNLDW